MRGEAPPINLRPAYAHRISNLLGILVGRFSGAFAPSLYINTPLPCTLVRTIYRQPAAYDRDRRMRQTIRTHMTSHLLTVWGLLIYVFWYWVISLLYVITSPVCRNPRPPRVQRIPLFRPPPLECRETSKHLRRTDRLSFGARDLGGVIFLRNLFWLNWDIYAGGISRILFLI